MTKEQIRQQALDILYSRNPSPLESVARETVILCIEDALIKAQPLVDALRQISQMSDPGDCITAIIDMKTIATTALASYEGEKENNEPNYKRLFSEAKSLLDIVYAYAQNHPEIKLGDSMIGFTVERAKKYDELVAKEPVMKDPWISQELAAKILRIRDDLIRRDIQEAYHILYSIADPNMDKFEPWAELEKIASEPPAATNQEGNKR